jgi:hypothetical protein
MQLVLRLAQLVLDLLAALAQEYAVDVGQGWDFLKRGAVRQERRQWRGRCEPRRGAEGAEVVQERARWLGVAHRGRVRLRAGAGRDGVVPREPGGVR